MTKGHQILATVKGYLQELLKTQVLENNPFTEVFRIYYLFLYSRIF